MKEIKQWKVCFFWRRFCRKGINLTDNYFSVTLDPEWIQKVPLEGSVAPVAMSMLWSGCNTKNIYKILEYHISSFKEADSATNNVSWQYFEYVSLYRGTDTDPRQSNILSTRFEICGKHKKTILKLFQNLEFIGVEINSKDMNLVLSEEKNNKMWNSIRFSWTA